MIKYILDKGQVDFDTILINLQYKKSISNRLNYLETVNATINQVTCRPKSLFEFIEDFKEHLNGKDQVDFFITMREQPEFTFWFLRHNAKHMFESEVNSDTFLENINHPKSKLYLKMRISEILKIEEMADQEYLSGDLDPFKPYKKKGFLSYNINFESIEYYRVIDDYYHDHLTEHEYWQFKSPEVKAYYMHLLLKPYLEDLLEKSTSNTENEQEQNDRHQPDFSVTEWATIFYYANETKLLPESRTIKTRIETFLNKYEIKTTLNYFRTQYYEVKKRINNKNDYPISKLELIIPFLKENYHQTVTKVENDILFLEENNPDY